MAESPSRLPEPAQVRVDFSATAITAHSATGEAGVVGRPVTINDPARVASISKLVGALAVMRLVDQRRIDLDRDINDYLGYSIRNPAFPDRKITLRHLLAHTSGIRDNIDYLIPLDGKLATVLANPDAWNPIHEPGDYFSYANLNSPVIAATIEAATRERFDRIVAKQVLAPLRLDACFNWGAGCSPQRRSQAVTLLRTNGGQLRSWSLPDRRKWLILQPPGRPADFSSGLVQDRAGADQWRSSAFVEQGLCRNDKDAMAVQWRQRGR